MLRIDLIRDIAASALLYEKFLLGSLFNAPGEEMLPDVANLYWEASKTKAQATNLLSVLNKLHEMLTDFERADFDKYIDQHTRFSEEGDEEYDPYEDLGYTLDPPCVTALPETIAQYGELLFFAGHHSRRKGLERKALKSFFSGLGTHYSGTDEEGNTVLIPEGEIDGDTKRRLEANREIRHIEAEHCLDNYDLWYLEMKRGISGRKPFSELLRLIMLE